MGKIATVQWPAIQMASSATMKCAQFFDSMAMREPCGKPWACRCAAMRAASSIAWAQVISMTWPLPMGWVNSTRCGCALAWARAMSRRRGVVLIPSG